MKKLLVTGASGFLGWNICKMAQSKWLVHGCYRSKRVLPLSVRHHQIDLTDFKALKILFKKVKPDAVIHTAGIRDPEFCQTHRSLSHKINTTASVNIAGLCAEIKALCLFVSSDMVFDGLNPPYREEDEPSPINVYGEHKAVAEQEMFRFHPQTVICRLPLIYGTAAPTVESFIQPLIRAIKAKTEICLFIDEFRTPINVRDAAEGIMLALKHLPGIIHIGGPETISRYEFGKLLVEVLKVANANIRSCRQSEVELEAPRPPDVSLDIQKARLFGFDPKSPKEGLTRIARDCLNE
jgi:dTDP-4-dehydrorhamnose reductase